MAHFWNFFKTLFAPFEPLYQYDEAYLAGSVDIYDLERRMRIIDERGRDPAAAITLGLYPR
jgi:hypothetical protein